VAGRFSALTGSGVLIVDLHEAGDFSQDELARVWSALAELPCATLAVGGEPLSAPAAKLADRVDVRVQREDELAPVLEAIDRAPVAALVLVQLLRRGEALPVYDGLVAESLAYSTLQGGPEFAAWLERRGVPKRRTQETGPALRVEREGSQLCITLSRPGRRNAFSAAMRDALVEALEVAASDSSIDEVVLTGAGPAFCSGGDLDEFGTTPDPATAHAVRSTRSAARLLAACSERVRAEVHGTCVGAGVELPAFAARVVARADATFQLPELAMGLVPGAGGTVSVPRRVGRQRAAWLALSGERIDAQTALAWGLVDEIR
jgi:enoyl-CoA hydratase/carnithine racemase